MHQTADKYKTIFIYTALTIVALVVFWQVHSFEFVNYDDNCYITDNPNITTGFTFENYCEAIAAPHFYMWHPMTSLSQMLDCQLFGLNSGRHHLINLLFHIANTLLLFTVLRKMTGLPRRSPDTDLSGFGTETGALWPSAFVAALFAIHPLNVESVAWVSERKTVLSAFFSFLTVAAYVRYVKRPQILNYLLVIAVCSLAFMSKPTTVTLPFVLLLLDYWPLNRFKWSKYQSPVMDYKKSSTWQLVKEKIPLLLLALVLCVLTIIAQKSGGVLASSERLPFYIRLENALVSYVAYIGKMFYPADLTVFYPHPTDTIFLWKPIVSFLLLIIISAGVYLGRRKAYLAVGWLWFLATLVPMIGLVQAGSQAMADRYAYVSLIGLFIIVVWSANDLLTRFPYHKLVLWVSSAVIISVLSVCTFVQIGYWKNSTTLWEHALEVTTGNCIAHNNLGRILFDQNRFEEALEHFREAVQIYPKYSHALINFGLTYNKLHPQDDVEACVQALKVSLGSFAVSSLRAVYGKTGRYKDEVETCEKTVLADPNNAEAYNNLGTAYSKVGRWEDAIAMCKRAIEIQPDFALAYNNLGSIYGLMSRYEEAIESLEQAVKIKRDYAEAYYNLGFTYDKLKRYQEAVEFYRQAVKSKPDYAEAYISLGVDLGRLEQHEKAIDAFNEAVRIDPNNMEAYGNLGVTYDKLDKFEQAIDAFEQAIKINPDNARLHFLLGSVYLKAGDKDSAQKECEILKTLDTEKAGKLSGRIQKYPAKQ